MRPPGQAVFRDIEKTHFSAPTRRISGAAYLVKYRRTIIFTQPSTKWCYLSQQTNLPPMLED